MGTKLIVEIDGNSAGLQKAIKDAGGSVKGFVAETEKGKKGTKDLSLSLDDLASDFGLPTSPAAALTAGIVALGAATVVSVNAAREGRAVQAQLAAVLESTHQAAGLSQAELNKHAEALQKVTNFDDEAIGSGQALLLTFDKIGKDIFPRATQTALDLATAFKMDLTSANTMLGKALNEPKEGLTALTRVGVSFTEAEKEMIKSMAEAGDTAGAQALMLEVVNKQVAGSAEAARAADGGFIALGNSTANLSEAFGNLIMAANDSTGYVEGMVSTVEELTQVVEGADDGIAGLAAAVDTLVSFANPLTPLMMALGVDVIPNVAASSEEAIEPITKMGEASALTAEQMEAQKEAAAALAQVQMEGLVDLAKLEEAYNEKKTELLEDRLKAESDASEATVKNSQDLNTKLQDNEKERAEKIKELHEKAAESEGKLTGDKFNAEMEKINKHHDEKGATIRDSYTEENDEIKAKLDERQAAIDEQLKKEEEQYKQKAQDLKLLIAAQALEQSGKLEEMTGIAGITAQQYVDAVKYGAIEANKEVEMEMGKIVKGFEGSQRDQKSLAESNAESIKRILGESYTSTAQSQKRATDSIVTDFERQAQAAYKAAQASGGTVNYSSNRGRGMAKGGSFTVPSGYPNDSYPMRVETGERVTVETASEARRNDAMALAGPGFAKGTGWATDDVKNKLSLAWSFENGKLTPPPWGSGPMPQSERVKGYGWDWKNMRVIPGTSSDYVSRSQFGGTGGLLAENSAISKGSTDIGRGSTAIGSAAHAASEAAFYSKPSTFARPKTAEEKAASAARAAAYSASGAGRAGGASSATFARAKTTSAAPSRAMEDEGSLAEEIASLTKPEGGSQVTKSSGKNITILNYSPVYNIPGGTSDPTNDYHLMKSLV